MNTINITGRLTSDLELKMTPSGVSVCSFTVAVKRPRSKDETDFLNCTAWRQSAEYLCKYGRKGNQVAVTGMLTSRKWEDQNGNKRTSFEIVVDNAESLTRRSDNAEGNLTDNMQNTSQSVNFDGNFKTQAGFETVSADTLEDLPF